MSKIMIVDDDLTTVKLLRTLLELDGFDVDVANRGADVMKKAFAFHPDLFLIDYHLTDMEGIDILRELRADNTFSQTPVVMTSGMDMTKEVMGAGANEFLMKPLDPEQLPKVFKQLLG